MYLPDINFWLAFTFDQHIHHVPARAWFDSSPVERPCYFCRLTQIGFLRLATNPKVNRLQTQTLSQAWLVYDGLLAERYFGRDLIRVHALRRLWAERQNQTVEPARSPPDRRTGVTVEQTHGGDDPYVAAESGTGRKRPRP